MAGTVWQSGAATIVRVGRGLHGGSAFNSARIGRHMHSRSQECPLSLSSHCQPIHISAVHVERSSRAPPTERGAQILCKLNTQ